MEHQNPEIQNPKKGHKKEQQKKGQKGKDERKEREGSVSEGGCKGDWTSFVGRPKEKASTRSLHRSLRAQKYLLNN